MLAALIVRRRAEVARRRRFHFNALKMAVEGKIEIQPRLLAVGDHVQTRRRLVMQCGDHGVILSLGHDRPRQNGQDAGRRIPASRETDSCQ